MNPENVYPRDLLNLPPQDHWVVFPWGTTAMGITNTCNFDSFLTHVIYLHMRNPRYFARVLNLVNSRTEQQIKQIVSMSFKRHPVNTFTLSARAHFMWHNMLISDQNKIHNFWEIAKMAMSSTWQEIEG